jgi:quercetin dioxygenase-like cupin family protein
MGDAGQEGIESRVVRRRDMVACKLAFIDCKMPGSDLKENYSLVGPGVTQSKDQVVNLTEAHGFSLGVAAMPPGTVNNLHIHYTAEVFMIFSGTWTFRWGDGGKEGEIVGRAGDVVSVPTWIFRGFTNSGSDDGWIFSALGGDDTGGIIWHPSILESAARHGLYLSRDNMLIDTEAGAPVPSADEQLKPISQADIQTLRHYTPEQMRERVVCAADRRFSPNSLLDSRLEGHGAEIAPVLGHGMSEDREEVTPVPNPHGFSIDWIRIPEHGVMGPFRITEKQVLIVFEGVADISLDLGRGAEATIVAAQELVSPPANSWRKIAAKDKPVLIAALTAGDARKRIEWAPDIVAAAHALGVGRDHNGYTAPTHLLPGAQRVA